MAKSDDRFKQSVIRFHFWILITVINEDVVFISQTCDSTGLKQLDQPSRKKSKESEPLPVVMASIRGQNFVKVFVLLSVFFLDKCSAKLNVFLDAREVSRFLYGK